MLYASVFRGSLPGVWRIKPGEAPERIIPGATTGMALLPGGRLARVRHTEPEVEVYDLENGRRLHGVTLPFASAEYHDLRLTPTGHLLAVNPIESAVDILDVRTLRLVGRVKAHKSDAVDPIHINSVVARPQGTLYVAFAAEGDEKEAWRKQEKAGVLRIVQPGGTRDILTGLALPHTLRAGLGWLAFCESGDSAIRVLTAKEMRRTNFGTGFARGLAKDETGWWVGMSTIREQAPIDAALIHAQESGEVDEEIRLPAQREIYDVLVAKE